MTVSFEHFTCPDSLLRRLDPRWKLAAFALAAIAAGGLQTLPAAALALVGALVLVCVSRLPLRWYLGRLAGLAPFLALLVLLLPIVVAEDEPLAHLGPLSLSWKGMRLALLVCAKAATIFTVMAVLLCTAPLLDTLHAAHALRVPGLLIQITLLTYRYLFLLASELGRLRVALRVRGYRHRASLHSYRTVAQVSGTLLVRSQERAERVGQAMRCRGFDGQFRSLTEFRTTMTDVAVFLLIVGSAAALVMWDFCIGH